MGFRSFEGDERLEESRQGKHGGGEDEPHGRGKEHAPSHPGEPGRPLMPLKPVEPVRLNCTSALAPNASEAYKTRSARASVAITLSPS